MKLFNFGRSNRLSLTPIWEDEVAQHPCYWWLNGRIFGHYISVKFFARNAPHAD